MSEKTATASPRKNKKNAAKDTAGASVQDITARAGGFIESAAIVRAAREAIAPAFASGPDVTCMPDALLQRRGAGPRPALTEAIVTAEFALEEVARQFEEHARGLLHLRVQVELGDGTRADGDELIHDEVVRRSDLEFALAAGEKKTEG